MREHSSHPNFKEDAMREQFILISYFIDESWPDLEPLVQPDWQLNNPLLPVGEKQDRMITLYKPLRDAVAQAIEQGVRPVSIAGDCCTSLGILAGIQKAGFDPTVIWMDAHGDFNTWETTPSGFLGGMPLAMMVGRGEQTIPAGIGMQPQTEGKIILSDARDLDPGEREALAGSEIQHLSQVEAMFDIALPEGPLYVHFDADILDPVDAPAMNYLVPGGPSAELMSRLFQRFAQTGRVIAVSLSSWNPKMKAAGRTRDTVMDLIIKLAG
jgi:arginase